MRRHASRLQESANSLYIENRALETVDEIRDLGFIISKDLQFTKHCQTVAKLAAQRMNCILRIFQTLNTSFLVKCFNTFVRSELEYGSQIWSPYRPMGGFHNRYLTLGNTYLREIGNERLVSSFIIRSVSDSLSGCYRRSVTYPRYGGRFSRPHLSRYLS